jgi:two-component system chemotaxis response regulator CheY
LRRIPHMHRILLVDDSRVMRSMLHDMLSAAGYADCEFIEAIDGQDALEKLAARKYEVDAIFCDLWMPNMDGLAFLDSLRAEGRLLPVIVLTADNRGSRGEEAIAKGAAGLLRKPFTREEVAGSLEKVLPRASSGGEARKG